MKGVMCTPGALKNWRAKVGMTQIQLAEELGVEQAAVSYWESGERPISPRTIRQLVALAKSWKVEPPKTRGALRGGKKAVKL